jgi:predicted nucleic acid-binding protein
VVGALFDTNILIDHLRGIEAARDELARYTDKAISLITWMEVLVGTPEPHRPVTRAFLDSFTRIEIDPRVAERAVALRQAQRIKLPDAIVWASAQVHGKLLVTRDTKGFPPGDPGIRMPYTVTT